VKRVAIVAAKRTPIGRFLGGFTYTTAVELGTTVVKELLAQTKLDPKEVGFVIFGQGRQAGNRPNPARQVAYFAGIPVETIAYTVNKTCGSGLLSIIHGYTHILNGDADIVIAGGMENMTRTPFILDRLRTGYRLGDAPVLDGQYFDGLLCPLSNLRMGETAENLVERYKIGREEQDFYAARSQNRCEKAWKEGKFAEEVVKVEAKDEKGRPQIVAEDEHYRKGVTVESLAKLEPAFRKGGSVTAGNACGMGDGAAAVVLMSEEKAEKLGLTPWAFIEGYSFAGVDPAYMGIAPVYAVRNLEKRVGRKVADYDLVELNEAFAAQVLACDRELHLDHERLNVNGGAIALSHPIGCTGARLVVTILYEMRRRNVKTGLVTLCQSGGLGTAVSLLRD
jgi:acetyl-CoA C-acetyltransferase